MTLISFRDPSYSNWILAHNFCSFHSLFYTLHNSKQFTCRNWHHSINNSALFAVWSRICQFLCFWLVGIEGREAWPVGVWCQCHSLPFCASPLSLSLFVFPHCPHDYFKTNSFRPLFAARRAGLSRVTTTCREKVILELFVCNNAFASK